MFYLSVLDQKVNFRYIIISYSDIIMKCRVEHYNIEYFVTYSCLYQHSNNESQLHLPI